MSHVVDFLKTLHLKHLNGLFDLTGDHPSLAGTKEDLGVAKWDAHAAGFYWQHHYIFLGAAVLYLPTIYLLSLWMRDRKAMELKWTLRVWNLIMCIFSVFGAVVTVPAMYRSFMENGLSGMVCGLWCYQMPHHLSWVLLFNMSKIAEFFDTILLVLRKREVIFMHWYHHLITYCFCWYMNQWGHFYNCSGLLFCTMNYFVHSIMYAYYAARSFNIKPWFDWIITQLQIIQMILGLLFLVVASQCNKEIDRFGLVFGIGMYISFFILFVRVYLRRYGNKTATGAAHQKKAE